MTGGGIDSESKARCRSYCNEAKVEAFSLFCGAFCRAQSLSTSCGISPPV
jgi:hypothetical protein